MRAQAASSSMERLHVAAARARDELRGACRRGDRRACEELRRLGELPPAPRHFASDIDEDDDEEAD